jgi:hypothetical protein
MADLLVRMGALTTREAIALSQQALDAPLATDVELTIAQLTGEATVLGAFQRPHGFPDGAQHSPLLRRGSGGPFVTVGDGTLHVLVALSHPAALVPCDAARLVNRHVRPLLRALTRSAALAHYFGRDWISVAHRPVGQVGFAHDSATGRATFEAFVAVASPFAPAGRASFRGKEPGTLTSITRRDFDLGKLTDLIARSYAQAGDRAVLEEPLVAPPPATPVTDDPPWTATVDEAIGALGAGVDAQGVFRLGGDLLASRDALTRIAARVAALPVADEAGVGRIVDEELTSPAVALEGVRDLGSLRRVLVEARRR